MPRGKAQVNLWDTATALANTDSITSKAISQRIAMGYCSLLVILTGSSPSVDITMTVGLSPTDTFYTPYDTAGTSLGTICTLTATRWVQFAPALAPHIKFTLTGTTGVNQSDTTIKAYLVFEEDL